MTASYIILVNWNGHQDTIECVESLLRSDSDDFRVVIVDNGSTDGSVETIKSWAEGALTPERTGPVWAQLPPERRMESTLSILTRDEAATMAPDGARITLITAGENLGFAAANNVGMAFAARDEGAEFFWVLNNDTVVAPAALPALVAYARSHSDHGIIGGILIYYDEPTMVQGVGGWLNAPRALAGHIGFGASIDQLPPAEEVEAQLDYVMGASMFVRRSTYDRVGGMSEKYFLYYEELDWAKRLPEGTTLGICYDAHIYHKEGKSIGTNSVSRPSNTSLYYSYASALRFYGSHERRHAPVAAARILYNLVDYARKRDTAAFRVTFQAFADVALGRPRRGAWGTDEFRRDHRRTTGPAI